MSESKNFAEDESQKKNEALDFKYQEEAHGVDQVNGAQDSNLSKLRQAISENKGERYVPEKIEAVIRELPTITQEDADLFNLKRHSELCSKVDIAHKNYIVSQKQLAQAWEELIDEGTKPRWG